MNVLPCEVKGGKASFAGNQVGAVNAGAYKGNGKVLELGVRPEFVSLGAEGIPVDIVKIADAGRYRIVEARHKGHSIKLLVAEGMALPEKTAHLQFDPAHTQIYEDGWMVS
jgi:glycerol transport system ATP-binding protein